MGTGHDRTLRWRDRPCDERPRAGNRAWPSPCDTGPRIPTHTAPKKKRRRIAGVLHRSRGANAPRRRVSLHVCHFICTEPFTLTVTVVLPPSTAIGALIFALSIAGAAIANIRGYGCTLRPLPTFTSRIE